MTKKDTTISLLREIRDLLKPETSGTSDKSAETTDLIKLEMKYYMTPRYLFGECEKLFQIWIYDESSLDRIKSEREGDYTVYFKNVQEADEENKNLSADDCKEKEIKGITLEERLLLEIEYFKKTGNHLDINNWTLCSGSRRSDGNVPYMHFDSDNQTVHVYWYYSDHPCDDLRARSVQKIS